MTIQTQLLERIKNKDPFLCYLDLSGTCNSDEDIEKLVNVATGNKIIQAIRVNNLGKKSTISARGISLLTALPNLYFLDISGNPIGRQGALSITRLPALKGVFYEGCGEGYELVSTKYESYDFYTNKIDEENQEMWTNYVKAIERRNKIQNDQSLNHKNREELEEDILFLIETEQLELLPKLLSELPDGVNTFLNYGCTPLSHAARKKAGKSVELLLKSGARLEDHEREYTAMFNSAEEGSAEIVKILLKYGSNITGEFYFNDETALSIAAFKFCHLLRPDGWNGIYASLLQSFSGPQVVFSQDKKLYINYTKQASEDYDRAKNITGSFDPDKLEKLNGYQKTYKLLLLKYELLQKKAPDPSKDDEGSDIEDDLELSHKIKRPMKPQKTTPMLTRPQLLEQIEKLNQELKNKTEDKIDWSQYPNFFIAQYRGIHYYRNHFTKPQRADHRSTFHLNRLAPAPAVYHKSNLTPVQHQLSRESVLKKGVQETKEIFEKLEASNPVKQYWGDKKQTFKNESDMHQQRMSNSYKAYKEDITNEAHTSMKLLHDKNLIGYPHYATSDLPFHALKYAYGQKKVDGLTEWRLRPVFQISGKPRHPYPGKVFISLFSPLEMHLSKTRHVAGMHNRKDIRLQGTVAPERETSIPGGLEAEIPFYEELLQIPSFESFENKFFSNYGLTLEVFEKFKKDIVNSLENPDQDEKDKVRKQVKKKLIEDFLIPYKQKQLIHIAQIEAERRGGYLIYRHFNGTYGIEPEGMRIPSKGNNFYPKAEQNLLSELATEALQQDMQLVSTAVRFENTELVLAENTHKRKASEDNILENINKKEELCSQTLQGQNYNLPDTNNNTSASPIQVNSNNLNLRLSSAQASLSSSSLMTDLQSANSSYPLSLPLFPTSNPPAEKNAASTGNEKNYCGFRKGFLLQQQPK